jgi:hypothetical protein
VSQRKGVSSLRPPGGTFRQLFSRRRQQLDRIDRLAQTPDFEVQLDLVGISVAHFRNLLSLDHVLSFLDQNYAVVAINTGISFVVLEHDQLAVPSNAGTAVKNGARRTGQDRLAGSASDIDAFAVCCLIKAGGKLAFRRPTPVNIFIIGRRFFIGGRLL